MDELLNHMIEELNSGRWDDYLNWLSSIYGFKGSIRDAFDPKLIRMYQSWIAETI